MATKAETSVTANAGPGNGPISPLAAPVGGDQAGANGTGAGTASTQPVAALWGNLPQELRARRQWLIAAPDKRPLRPGTGGRLINANIKKPEQWLDFDTACQLARAHPGHGIGYVLAADDPFTCIDLDVKDDTPEQVVAGYQDAIRSFNSYTERSSSGRGFHIWVKGKIGPGKRRDRVEVYSQGRFMVCTGNVYFNRPIAERQDMLNDLLPQLAPITPDVELVELEPDAADWHVLEMARKYDPHIFPLLWEGKVEIGEKGKYPSQSEADFALIKDLARHTQSNSQVRQLFRQSALGQREKANKNDYYLNNTLKRARNELLQDEEHLAHGAEIAKRILRKWEADRKAWGANKLVSIADLFSNPPKPQKFYIDEIMPAGVLTLLSAHGGTGKSMVALTAAVALAMGRPFMGKPTERCRVLFWSAEDPESVVRHRLARICRHQVIDPNELARWLTVIDATQEPVLYAESHRGEKRGVTSAAYDRLKQQIDALGVNVIIIDNASDTFDANENERARVREFCRLLVQLGAEREAAVLLLAHIDKHTAKSQGSGEGYSGSTAWHNSARSRLFMSVKDGVLVLEHQKSNYGRRAGNIRMRFNEKGLLEPAEPEASIEDLIPQVVRLIDGLCQEGTRIRPAQNSQYNAYRLLKDRPGFPKELDRERLTAVINEAVARGLLKWETFKNNQRRTFVGLQVIGNDAIGDAE